jgi:putative phage-type endonuclease
VIAGLSRYKSRYALWLEKTGEAMQDDGPSEEAWWGLELENVIKHRLSTHHEVETVAQQVTMSHEDHPWLTCTIDGVDENGEIWEYKAAGFSIAKGLENGDVSSLPNAWVLQVHHQMFVANQDVAHIAAFAGHALKLYTFDVYFDRLLWSELFSLEREFWDRVQRRIPPGEFDASDAKLLLNQYRGAEPEIALDYFTSSPYCVQYEEETRAAKDHQVLAEAAKAKLLGLMRDAKAATCGPYRLTRTMVNVKADPAPKPRDAFSYIRFGFKNKDYPND